MRLAFLRLLVCSMLGAACVACSAGSAGTSAVGNGDTLLPPSPASSAPLVQPTWSAESAHRTAKPRKATAPCPKGPDVLYREIDPGLPALTARVGYYGWDAQLNKCLDAVAFARATLPAVHGVCATLALARDNRHYNVDAQPSRPLRHVIATLGDGCHGK